MPSTLRSTVPSGSWNCIFNQKFINFLVPKEMVREMVRETARHYWHSSGMLLTVADAIWLFEGTAWSFERMDIRRDGIRKNSMVIACGACLAYMPAIHSIKLHLASQLRIQRWPLGPDDRQGRSPIYIVQLFRLFGAPPDHLIAFDSSSYCPRIAFLSSSYCLHVLP